MLMLWRLLTRISLDFDSLCRRDAEAILLEFDRVCKSEIWTLAIEAGAQYAEDDVPIRLKALLLCKLEDPARSQRGFWLLQAMTLF